MLCTNYLPDMLIFKPVFPRSVNNYPQVILRHLSQVRHRLRNIPVLLIEVFKQALQADNVQTAKGECGRQQIKLEDLREN